MKPVGVVGLGVVGGTVARAFEEVGIEVRRFDRYLNIGEPADMEGCGVVFVCVPTPIADDGSHDIKEVWAAVRAIEPSVEIGTVIAFKSTVPPGTADQLAPAFPRLQFASVPEFLVAAHPMESFTRPDRIVIGAPTDDVARVIEEIMRRVAPSSPVLLLLPIEAELAKLCSNAALAAKVTLANEFFEICSRFGARWQRIQAAVGLDRRIGPDHLTVTAERGFGGACLPKDLDGFIEATRATGYEPLILSIIAAFNRQLRGEDTVLSIPEPAVGGVPASPGEIRGQATHDDS